MSRFKLIMYSVWAAIALTVVIAFFKTFARKALDNGAIEDFKKKLDNNKMKLHQKVASEASKEAFEHIRKARQFASSGKEAPKPSKTIEEAISAWNEDND